MPELPEVETVKRGLERTIVGKTIASVELRNPGQFRDGRQYIDRFLVGARVESVERRGKIILVQLSNQWVLVIHLKMTGQLVLSQIANRKSQIEKEGFIGGHPEKAYEAPLPHKHTHVVIHFTDGSTLYFNDLRKFGWMRLLRSNSQRRMKNEERRTERRAKDDPSLEDFLESLRHGPEPFSDEFTVDYLWREAKKRAIPIKTFLLDQTVVAGVGNIYADEALFESKIRPTRKSKSLTRAESERLHQAIKHVLQLGIDYGGTTLNAYVNVEGTAGKMRERLLVYGREDQPCSACATPIKRIKIGQRSSHYCPTCQR